MPSYTFTGPYPRVFPDLQVGAGVTVRSADPATPAPPAGSTVELAPCDVLTTDIPVTHPELALLESPAAATPGKPSKIPAL